MLKFLELFANKIVNLNRKTENINSQKLEILVLVLYCILHIIISFFHEPWFDEAVAWQIAKVANIKEILFEIPHYEGHPPLWHLILIPFAKLGMPYEFSLSLVSLIFSGLTMYFILWYSSFPRLIKLLLPFNYFLFYQYGVISRPYCMMMLAFVLLAITYKKHNERPFLYIASLIFLCLTSAYGIVISGGIAIAWIIEIFFEKNMLKNFYKDKRIVALAILLIVALSVIIMIIPYGDTVAVANERYLEDKNSYFVLLLYMLICIFADLTLLNFYSSGLLKSFNFNYDFIIPAVVLGIVILIGIICFAKKKRKIILFVIPYLLYAIFSSVVYLNIHHIGILYLFFIFWFWVALDTKETINIFRSMSSTDKKCIMNFYILFATVCFLVPIFWNIASCIGDIKYSYSCGRNEANFIKENCLDKYKILVSWRVEYNREKDEILLVNTNISDEYAHVAPYFDDNISYNFMNGENNQNYIVHRSLSDIENKNNFETWKRNGQPDVILGFAELKMIFSEKELSYDDYTLVSLENYKHIWKYPNKYSYVVPIFVRKNLVKELNLQEISKLNLPWDWYLIYN